MEQVELGQSGIRVSRVGLGCNNFGGRIDFDATQAVVDAALEAGITFFDTAEVYGGGNSERFLGELLEVCHWLTRLKTAPERDKPPKAKSPTAADVRAFLRDRGRQLRNEPLDAHNRLDVADLGTRYRLRTHYEDVVVHDQINGNTTPVEAPSLRPGETFADADLFGCPVRITGGKKGLVGGRVDVLTRAGRHEERVQVSDVINRMTEGA